MSEIRFEVRDHVAVITLAAPERRNALTPEMSAELIEACELADKNSEVGAVVLLAEGQGFCAGASRGDLETVGADPAREDSYRRMRIAYESFYRVGQLQPPTIAAVRGAAVGAGLNLAFATDLTVVAEDARLISGFLRIGIHPGGGHFSLMSRSMPRQTIVGMSIFGRELSGRQAADLGLVWTALPADEVDRYAIELAQGVAADPELARAATRSLRMELGPPVLPWAAALEAETASQMWSLRRRAAPASG